MHNDNTYIPFTEYPDVLTIEQLQNALGIGRSTAYKLINNGDIQSIRIGRAIRIPKRYILDYLYRECYNKATTSGLTVLKEVLS